MMQWLEDKMGLKLIEKSDEPAPISLAASIGSSDDRTQVKGFFGVGDMTFQDIPAALLHELALHRNTEISDSAVELAEIMQEVELNLHSLTALSDTLKRNLSKPMPDHLRQRHHPILFRALRIGKLQHKYFKYTENSLILIYYIPTLEVYRIAYENLDPNSASAHSQTPRDFDNWKNFVLSSQAPFSKFFSKSLSAYIDFNAFKEHGYVLGATKAGKTEVLKLIAHHIITNTMKHNPKAGGIIIDPHGDFAREVSTFKECYGNDRVIVFDTTLYDDKTPSIDIFSPPSNDEKTIEIYADNLVKAFDEIISDASLSTNMEAVLSPCISVLLRRPNSSIEDLQRFMLPEGAEDLIELGQQSPIRGQANFFKHAFHQKKYDPTKSAIYTRLQILLNFKIFSRLVNPKGGLCIEKELNNGKFIIMNLSQGAVGDSVSSTFGRLVVALAKSTGFRRESTPKNQRPESYIFIDECQNYVSFSMNKIFSEMRKYGIHLILANQYLGQDMNTQLVKSIMTNTGVKISGKNSASTNSAMAKEMGIDAAQLDNLATGSFAAKIKLSRPTEAFIFRAPTHCLEFSNYMGKERWNETLRRGWVGYTSNRVLDAAYEEHSEPHIAAEEVSEAHTPPANG